MKHESWIRKLIFPVNLIKILYSYSRYKLNFEKKCYRILKEFCRWPAAYRYNFIDHSTGSKFHSQSFFLYIPFKHGTKEFYKWIIRVSSSWYCEKNVFEWHCKYCLGHIITHRCHIIAMLYAFFCTVRPFTNIIW